MLRQAARGLMRCGASRNITSSAAVWQEASEQSKEVGSSELVDVFSENRSCLEGLRSCDLSLFAY